MNSTRTVHIDLPEEALKGLTVGEKVELKVSGIVRSVNAPYEYKDIDGEFEKEPYGSVSLKLSSVSKNDEDNFFSEISED